MPNEQKQEGETFTSHSRLEMYAVLGLELGKKVLEHLENVEKAIEALAMQKARELESNDKG